jgi:hypothetical protein
MRARFLHRLAGPEHTLTRSDNHPPIITARIRVDPAAWSTVPTLAKLASVFCRHAVPQKLDRVNERSVKAEPPSSYVRMSR